MNNFWALTLGACLIFDYPSDGIPADVTVAPAPEPEPKVVLPEVFDDIIRCESGGNPEAQNPVSTASGLFQFIEGTWLWVWQDLKGVEPPAPEAWQASVHDQTRAAQTLYSTRGLTPWYASKHCWGN